jgi:hypothetical protein
MSLSQQIMLPNLCQSLARATGSEFMNFFTVKQITYSGEGSGHAGHAVHD